MPETPDQESRIVLISGGTGFIGQALVSALQQVGWKPVILTRSPSTSACAPSIGFDELPRLEQADAIINLAGANIGAARWTKARKQELRDSRLRTTQALCEWAATRKTAPRTFVSASAIGFYGDTADTLTDEQGAPGSDFGAQLCQDWESAVRTPEITRCVTLRIGVVIGCGGGALQRMLLPFKLGLGGPVGNGRQWMSWISRDDLVGLMIRALDQPTMEGTYNAVAPTPVTNREFSRTLGAALKRPALLPLPAIALKFMLGEMSSLLLASQRIVSSRLENTGFAFTHPTIATALAAAVR